MASRPCEPSIDPLAHCLLVHGLESSLLVVAAHHALLDAQGVSWLADAVLRLSRDAGCAPPHQVIRISDWELARASLGSKAIRVLAKAAAGRAFGAAAATLQPGRASLRGGKPLFALRLLSPAPFDALRERALDAKVSYPLSAAATLARAVARAEGRALEWGYVRRLGPSQLNRLALGNHIALEDAGTIAPEDDPIDVARELEARSDEASGLAGNVLASLFRRAAAASYAQIGGGLMVSLPIHSGTDASAPRALGDAGIVASFGALAPRGAGELNVYCGLNVSAASGYVAVCGRGSDLAARRRVDAAADEVQRTLLGLVEGRAA